MMISTENDDQNNTFNGVDRQNDSV